MVRGAALLPYWCDKCQKLVCEALPGAAVWCSCGRMAKVVKESNRKERSHQSEAQQISIGTGQAEQVQLSI